MNDGLDPVRARLKLSCLVKRHETGHLVVRNRIYGRVFNTGWVAKSRPKKTERRLWYAAVAAMMLLGLGGIGVWYYWTVVEPRLRKADEWATSLETTSVEEDAQRYYEHLSGQRVDPSLSEPLRGYEGQAIKIYKQFLVRRGAEIQERANEFFERGSLDQALGVTRKDVATGAVALAQRFGSEPQNRRERC